MWELAICLLADGGGGGLIIARTFFSKGDNKCGHLSIYHSMLRVNSTQVGGGGCGVVERGRAFRLRIVG